MAVSIVALVGSYRRGGVTDTAVDAILAGAREAGAETRKIYLLDRHIEFCTNCRSCTQQPGSRGECVQNDGFAPLLAELDAADALVLAAPVNFFNVTALFRRFLERMVVSAYWPWGTPAPKVRPPKPVREAAVVTSAAMPTVAIPFATGALRALKAAANVLGTKPVASLYVGFSAVQPRYELPPRVMKKARAIGRKLAKNAAKRQHRQALASAREVATTTKL